LASFKNGLTLLVANPSVGKNALWLMLATTLQKVVAFFAFLVIAKVTGPRVTGEYFYAVSITSMWVTVMDLGLTPVVIRAYAASIAEGQAVLAKAWRVKRWLMPLAIIGAISYPLLAKLDQETVLAVALACFVMSADTISLLWYGVLRGRQLLRFEAIGMFFGQCITALLSLCIVFLGGRVYGLIFSLFMGSLWNLGWSWWHVRSLRVEKESASVDWRNLFLQALPFGLAGIFVKVYSYVDTLMIRQWHGPIAVGQYALAYKLTYALQFLPLTFVAALYPALSATFAKKETEKTQVLFRDAWRLMAMVGCLAAAFLSGFAPRLVPFLLGDRYPEAGTILAILAWVLAPIFLDFPIGSLLNASHRAGQKTTAMGITMAVNMLLNALLVPRLAGIGAAWAAVGSFSMLVLMGWMFSAPLLEEKRALLWIAVRAGGVGGILWLMIRFVLPQVWLPLAVGIATAIAVLGLGLFRLLSKEDLLSLESLVRRRSSSV
jgi:O-antigen/teichoic acid export membrane protein